MKTWKLNTSNLGKFEEFKQLFNRYGDTIEATHIDLNEIVATPIEVIAHKASQLEDNIIVDDTTLDIEGASIGIHVRFLLEHLPEYAGRKATWTTYLAYRKEHQVLIYKGVVKGTIALPQGATGYGFDPVFIPEGSTKTLAEFKPDSCNARAIAVEALVKGEVWMTHPLIETWSGPWQD
jgi:XTP/dITP diphosphohydrolase